MVNLYSVRTIYFNINLDLKMKYETFCAIDLFINEKNPFQNTFLDIVLGVNLCVRVCMVNRIYTM
jgi:hypothetical protein